MNAIHTDRNTPAGLNGATIRHEQAHAAREAAQILLNAGFNSVAAMVLRLAREKELPPGQCEQRQFFRDTYLVTVVRDEPHALDDLEAIAEAITTGGFTGQHSLVCTEALDRQQLREACQAVGSDPAFFGELDDDQEEHPVAERGS